MTLTFTAPETDDTLETFYRRARPPGPGWALLARRVGAPAPGPIAGQLFDWVTGVATIYGVLFGVGTLLLNDTILALPMLGASLLSGMWLYRRLKARGWGSLTL